MPTHHQLSATSTVYPAKTPVHRNPLEAAAAVRYSSTIATHLPRLKMKKSTTSYVAIAVVILFAVLLVNLWSPFSPHGATLNWDGDVYEGPVATIVGALVGGAGLVIGLVGALFGLAVAAIVMAGVGAALLTAFVLAVLLFAAIAVPFTLPLLIPIAILWFIVSRIRKQRAYAQPV
jgi:hypothetical protein